MMIGFYLALVGGAVLARHKRVLVWAVLVLTVALALGTRSSGDSVAATLQKGFIALAYLVVAVAAGVGLRHLGDRMDRAG